MELLSTSNSYIWLMLVSLFLKSLKVWWVHDVWGKKEDTTTVCTTTVCEWVYLHHNYIKKWVIELSLLGRDFLSVILWYKKPWTVVCRSKYHQNFIGSFFLFQPRYWGILWGHRWLIWLWMWWKNFILRYSMNHHFRLGDSPCWWSQSLKWWSARDRDGCVHCHCFLSIKK